ncbi:MAG TPA: hypothetical protein VF085_03035 [Solirubrobacterales bacterium]
MQRRIRIAIQRLNTPKGAWIALATAMVLAGALILATAHGQTFGIDEIFYLGRLVEDSGQIVQHQSLSLNYLFAPYNGHLQVGGKLIYEATFALAGADYTAFVLVNIAALCASVGLAFELARRRVGPLAALAPCVLLLFLGFAREVLLWPFDLHTLVAIAFGLAALLALEREDRRGDVLACVSITLSIATIEVGIAILVGIAVLVLMRPHRLRRAWVFILPAAFYAAWWIWARKFHQDQSALSIENIDLIPKTAFYALAAALGALTGTNPVVPADYTTVVTWFGKALAVLASLAVAVRLRRGSIPRTLWAWLAILLFYWVTMGAAARPPEGSRYLFFSAVGVLLVAAEALGGRVGKRLTAGVVVIALLALPANIAQLRSGYEEDTLHRDAPVSRTEWAMLELARDRVDPEYVATSDPRVVAAGGGLFIGIPAGAYLRRVESDGSPAFSLDELRGQEERLRLLADATLVGALGIETKDATAPPTERGCRTVELERGAEFATFPLPAGTTLLRASAPHTAFWLQRFAHAPRSVGIDYLPAGHWVKLTIPPDGAADVWHGTVSAPVEACYPD